MDRVTIIYGLEDPETKQLRYVGKTVVGTRKRLEAHISAARRNVRRPCSDWIRSLLGRGLRPEIFEIETCPAGSDWEEAEQFWIENFKTLGCRLFNIALGGNVGALGYRASEQTRQKMKAALRGRAVSAETRAKIGAANRGRYQPLRALNVVRRGEESSKAKITAKDVPVIRALRAGGYSGKQIASLYGITKQACDDIHKRVSWSHVPESQVDISAIVVPPIRRLRGAEIGTTKLTEAAVRDIRRRLVGKRGTRESGRTLAMEYGVTATTISDVRTRKIWRHV